MIDLNCTSAKYIDLNVKSSKTSHKEIFEKFVHALLLLERLETINKQYPFVFKGGTSILLLLGNKATRFSIDIDISMSDKLYKDKSLDETLKNLTDKVFYKVELDIRLSKRNKLLPIKHFKFFYHSQFAKTPEPYILLDITFQNVSFSTHLVGISHHLVQQKGNPANVNIINFNDLIGDKLTAIGPNTIGISHNAKNQFGRPKNVEAIKQLVDVALLSDYLTDLNVACSVYKNVAEWQIRHLGKNCNVSDCLIDAIKTCEIILRKNEKDKKYRYYYEGLVGFNDYKIGDSLTEIDLIKAAAQVIILATKILKKIGRDNVKPYGKPQEYFKCKCINEKALKLNLGEKMFNTFVKNCCNYLK